MKLSVSLNALPFEKWASELSQRGLKNAIRRAVDKSATAARRVAVQVIASDIGVPKARIRDGVTKVKRTTQYNLSASFTASKLRIGMLATGAAVTKANGFTGSTFRQTGGGSANLRAPHAFIIESNGGRFVAMRRGRDRLPVKGLYAEMPNQAMGQSDAAAQKAWKKEAEAQLNARLGAEVQKQLISEGLPYTPPTDDND
ncbi:hypothetical protein I6F38_37735 [Bradyrhizobium sp. BRP56]|nr:hypothetical protein [Bradyrhizobium sp. BRP56]